MITRLWLLKVSERYNKKQYRRFRAKNAEDKFLRSIGLDQIPPGFEHSTKRMQWNYEKSLFSALHFLRWRLKRILPPAIINRPPSQEQLRLAQMFKAIRNRIIVSNLGLIGKCICSSTIKADPEEMQCVARVALLNASEGFDPWRGWRFSTYASHCILRSFYQLTQKKQLKVIDGADPGDQIMLNETEPNKEYFLERLQKILRSSQHNLNESEIEVVSKRYGISLNGFRTRPSTLAQIAKQKRLSKERIRQIQIIALKKLQLALDNEASSQ